MKLLSLFFVFILSSFFATAQTYTGSGGAIPDNAPPVNFTQLVSGLPGGGLNQAYGLKTICVSINHTYVQDLAARIIAPDGTSFTLFAGIGGGGQNFTNTCFDTSASTAIAAGSAPFNGLFLPSGSIGNVNNGQNGNGVWTLQVQDNAAVDTGVVLSWSLTFGAIAPVPHLIKTDLPLVVITTHNQTIQDGIKITATMKIVNNGNGNLNIENQAGTAYSGNIGIAIRGAYSSSLPQKPYSVELRKVDGINDTSVSLLNMPKEQDWILLATYNDKSFIRNPLMYRMFEQMGHYAARSTPVEVVLDGEYIGVYLLMEKIKRDNKRVAIAKLKRTDLAGDSITGGYIFKHDYSAAGWTSNFDAPNCPGNYYQYNYEYPKVDSIQPQQATYLRSFVDSFESTLYSNHFTAVGNGYRKYINSISFVDYLLCNELAWNGDGYKKSMYFYKDKSSKDSTLHAGPIWDFDWALKCMPWTPTDYSGWYYNADPCSGDVLYLPWWDRMMQDTTFQNEVRCHWDYFRQHELATLAINHYIDSMAYVLRNAQQRHFNKWMILGINTGTPENAPFSSTYQEEIDTLKSILAQRMLWMDVNLPGHCYEPYHPIYESENADPITSLLVYPNPVTDFVNIQSNAAVEEIRVVNLLGQAQIKMDRRNADGPLQLETKSWLSGMYIIQVRLRDGRQLLGKFVKQ